MPQTWKTARTKRVWIILIDPVVHVQHFMAKLHSLEDNWVVRFNGSALSTTWVCFWTDAGLWNKLSSSLHLVSYVSWNEGSIWDMVLWAEKGLFYRAARSPPGISP